MGKPNLKPCPLCGKDVAELSDCQKVEGCANFEECDGPAMSIVVCDVLQGGCGCSTGYYKTRERAAEAWNRRAERTCNIVKSNDVRDGDGFYLCTVYELSCGHVARLAGGKLNYCPNCGAKVVDK